MDFECFKIKKGLLFRKPNLLLLNCSFKFKKIRLSIKALNKFTASGKSCDKRTIILLNQTRK